jgi:hypothetical protein
MKIAVEGCMHGELSKMYETIADIERRESCKIDLVSKPGANVMILELFLLETIGAFD